MKPAWDQLAEAFADSKTAIIVDVDCTKDENKDLCSKYGVRGYPTIKYFTEGTDPMGDKYEGGRDFDALKAFADENLGPSCSYSNLDLCSEEQKTEIEAVAAMSQEDRTAKIKELDAKSEAAEKKFKTEVEKLQKKYEKLSKEKDDAVAALGPELRSLRSVDGAIAKAAKGKDEL